jgi:hypothetical protein
VVVVEPKQTDPVLRGHLAKEALAAADKTAVHFMALEAAAGKVVLAAMELLQVGEEMAALRLPLLFQVPAQIIRVAAAAAVRLIAVLFLVVRVLVELAVTLVQTLPLTLVLVVADVVTTLLGCLVEMVALALS